MIIIFNKKILFAFILGYSCISFSQSSTKIWNRHVIDNAHSGADGVRLYDVNNDQLMDITTGWEEGGLTKVYLNPGYNHAKEKWPSVTVGTTPSVEDAVFVDLNNDNAIDVVSSTEGKDQKMYINWAPENPKEYLNAKKWDSEIIPVSNGLMQWMFAIPSQIDNLNGLDLIVGSKGDAKIGWFQAPKNPKQLNDWKWFPISNVSWTMSIFMNDMDNDGDADIVITDRKPSLTNGVRWLENPNEQKNKYEPWQNHLIGANNVEVMFMDIHDLDSDGLDDIIVPEYTNQQIVFMKRLDDSGLNWKQYPIDIPKIAGRAKALSIGDIDNDGQIDIVLSTNTMKKEDAHGIIWLSYTNSPTDSNWETHYLSGTVGYKFDRIELLDLDGDGDLDVLTCEENYGSDSNGLGVIWYENPLK